jgi:four helix bundle protein
MASSKVGYLEDTAVNASSSMARQRPAAQSFCDLVVWQKAHQFVLAVYRYTAGFPQPETYGLSLQMRRAAVSIAANIAEGFAKRSKAEKARFLNVAEGSVEESRYFLILGQDLGYGQTQDLMKLLEEVSRLLNTYTRTLLASGS